MICYVLSHYYALTSKSSKENVMVFSPLNRRTFERPTGFAVAAMPSLLVTSTTQYDRAGVAVTLMDGLQ